MTTVKQSALSPGYFCSAVFKMCSDTLAYRNDSTVKCLENTWNESLCCPIFGMWPTSPAGASQEATNPIYCDVLLMHRLMHRVNQILFLVIYVINVGIRNYLRVLTFAILKALSLNTVYYRVKCTRFRSLI